jgi:hypothetical protein
MKTIVFFFVVLFLLINCSKKNDRDSHLDTESKLKPEINFSSREIDLGYLLTDTIIMTELGIANTGEVNLIIESVEVECGCTGYELENDTIIPGNSTRLFVSYNTKGSEKGLHRKVIIIKSNTENSLILYS